MKRIVVVMILCLFIGGLPGSTHTLMDEKGGSTSFQAQADDLEQPALDVVDLRPEGTVLFFQEVQLFHGACLPFRHRLRRCLE